MNLQKSIDAQLLMTAIWAAAFVSIIAWIIRSPTGWLAFYGVCFLVGTVSLVLSYNELALLVDDIEEELGDDDDE